MLNQTNIQEQKSTTTNRSIPCICRFNTRCLTNNEECYDVLLNLFKLKWNFPNTLTSSKNDKSCFNHAGLSKTSSEHKNNKDFPK